MIFDIKMRNLISDPRIQFPIAAPLPLSPLFKLDGVTQQISNVYDGLVFHLPNYIISKKTGYSWKLNLNLENLGSSISDRRNLVEFLMRRDNSKGLLINTLVSSLLERENLEVLAGIYKSLLSPLKTRLRNEFLEEDNVAEERVQQYWNEYLNHQTSEKVEDQRLSLSTISKVSTTQKKLEQSYEYFCHSGRISLQSTKTC